ncbi:anaphase promoting complex subunit doc1 [Aspergillus nanangensis]|uniref:Anaphase promoting complex subunit doc1 n=1 Tax=Aspergillus nanangensis TaxID=2582783 RepID=A0AAD4CG53_ASPNN|nr:anaphase promoting complex subunit doc1 [Aspergillus nanangensis]
MPRHHLRRQHPAHATDPNTPDSPPGQTPRPRLGHAPRQPQFHTPPTRGIPQLHPSSGPIPAPVATEPVHPAAAAQAAIFSLFGRGVPGRPRGSMMDEFEDYDEADEDQDQVDAQDDSQFEEQATDERLGFEGDHSINNPDGGDISDDGMDEMVGNELEEIEDEDEMMQDRVPVVKIRVYLDFDMDESYTPTKMAFLAGMGGNDLVEFATWEGDAPCGWVDVPLEGVGGRNCGWVRQRQPRKKHRRKDRGGVGSSARMGRKGLSHSENLPRLYRDEEDNAFDYDDDDEEGEDDEEENGDHFAGSVLKAMVIQMRVIENHQNGKDTHVRGFQVFARDDDRRRLGNAPSASADGRARRHSARKSLRGIHEDARDGRDNHGDLDRGKVTGLEEPDWMGEPVIR